MASWSMSFASRNSPSDMTEEVHVTHSLHPRRNNISDFLLQKERNSASKGVAKSFSVFYYLYHVYHVYHACGWPSGFHLFIQWAYTCRAYLPLELYNRMWFSRGAARHLIRINWIVAMVTSGCLLSPVVVSSWIKVRLSVHCLFLCLTVAW